MEWIHKRRHTNFLYSCFVYVTSNRCWTTVPLFFAILHVIDKVFYFFAIKVSTTHRIRDSVYALWIDLCHHSKHLRLKSFGQQFSFALWVNWYWLFADRIGVAIIQANYFPNMDKEKRHKEVRILNFDVCLQMCVFLPLS